MLLPRIRPATELDVSAITAIYAHHVRHSAATFEIDPPDSQEMDRRRMAIQSQGLPYLVVEKKDVIAGYAYAGPYRARPAYRFSVEDSIYIHPDFQAQGFGRLLLANLIDLCIAQRRRQMIAIIGDRANIASIRLHTSFGFRNVGYLDGIGRKFGRWIDTVIMQRALSTQEPFEEE
jgi:L-amino acid N-acyltransferase YncA